MDKLVEPGQWWLLLIPLGTGVFALVGSWLGARLGRTNEHWQWLRNEKRKEYIAASDSISIRLQRINALVTGVPLLTIPEREPASYGTLNILAPVPVKRKLIEATNSIDHCLDALEDFESDTRLERASEKYNDATAHFDELVACMRKDLGIKA